MRRGLALPLAVVALGALASGCGGGGGDSAAADRVAVRDFEFSPTRHTIEAGERVTWENDGEQIHNVKGRSFFSRAMEPGETYGFTFRRPGSYDYVCTLHPQMKGTVVVE